MRSSLPKVLHPLAGRPLLGHLLETARCLDPIRLLVVTGFQSERIHAQFPQNDITWVYQAEQLGTAHAVMTALPALAGLAGELLILSGDTPLVEEATLRTLVEQHRSQGAGVTLVSSTVANPKGYGRIVRDGSGTVLRVVEEKDASEQQRAITEVNCGIYCVDLLRLAPWLDKISADNAQREYYLPDVVAVALAESLGAVGVFHYADASSLAGVNNRRQLAEMEVVFRDRLVARLQDEGVTFMDPRSCWLAADVVIGQDTLLWPNVILGPETRIGIECRIGPFCEISHSQIGANSEIKGFCHLEGAVTEGSNSIGPYARLRPGTVLAQGVKVGNFCEIKKSHIGRDSKINHLSYIGDTQMGKNVNVGAGTITCNYDGAHKHQTTIGDGVFIGSDTQLVAPVRVGDRAVIAAGTTVTKNVPEDDLAISRIKQIHIPGWSKRKT